MLAAALIALAHRSIAPQAAGSSPGLVLLIGHQVDERTLRFPELGLADRSGVSLIAGDAPDGEPLFAVSRQVETMNVRALQIDPAIAAVREAALIGLSAGTMREWSVVLRPRGRESKLADALREAWRSGALVAARGERAALLCESFVTVPDAVTVADPHDIGRARIGRGLGLQSWAVLDTDERCDGSFEPLLRALASSTEHLGAWLDDRAVLAVEPSAHATACDGSYVLLIDLGRARSVARSILAARLTILRGGDRWLHGDRTVRHPQGRRSIAVRTPAAEITLADPFAADALVAALEPLGAAPPQQISLRGTRCTLELVLDGDSHVARGEDGATAWVALRADVTWDAR